MFILARGLFMVVVIGSWIYAVYDVIRSDQEAVRHLHKLVWLALVVIVPMVGVPAWLFVGKPVPLGSRLTAIFEPRPGGSVPPDDSPEFLARLDDELRRRRRTGRRAPEPTAAEIDEEIRRLEEELRRRSEGPGSPADGEPAS